MFEGERREKEEEKEEALRASSVGCESVGGGGGEKSGIDGESDGGTPSPPPPPRPPAKLPWHVDQHPRRGGRRTIQSFVDLLGTDAAGMAVCSHNTFSLNLRLSPIDMPSFHWW